MSCGLGQSHGVRHSQAPVQREGSCSPDVCEVNVPVSEVVARGPRWGEHRNHICAFGRLPRWLRDMSSDNLNSAPSSCAALGQACTLSGPCFFLCEVMGVDHQEFPARVGLTQPHVSGRPTGRSTPEFTWILGSFSTPCSKHCSQTGCPKGKVFDAPRGHDP